MTKKGKNSKADRVDKNNKNNKKKQFEESEDEYSDSEFNEGEFEEDDETNVDFEEDYEDEDVEDEDKLDDNNEAEDEKDAVEYEENDDCYYKYAEESDNEFFDEELEDIKEKIELKGDERVGKPVLFYDERIRLLGDRTKQLFLSAKCLVKGTDGLTPLQKAELEIEHGVCPILVERDMCNGYYESWHVSELKR